MHCRQISSFAIVMLLAAVSAFAQATSSLRVQVTDSDGGVLPGVSLQLVNPQSGFKREAVSDGIGAYQFSQVPPGAYELKADLEGFKSTTAQVTLRVNTPVTVGLKLDIAGVAEAVTVEAKTVLVNTVDATVGNSFVETQVKQLPLSTRNVVELLSLQPGVTQTGEVVGAKRDQNNITLDGVDVNDNQTAGLESTTGANSQPGLNFNPAGGFREGGFNAALPVPLDSVQEFRVTVLGQNANQGRSSGGQVTLVTKSGTNQYHGSAYEYNRNNATSANDWFNIRAGIPVTPLNRNQYGASLGGPIVENRVFFFGNFEQRKDDSAQSVLRRVGSATLNQGIILAKASDGNTYTLNSAAIQAIDPLGMGINPLTMRTINQLPGANDPASGIDGGLNFAGYRFNAPQTVNNKAYVMRADVKLDSHSAHNLSFRATIADAAQDDLLSQYPGSAPTGTTNNKSYGGALAYTAVLSRNLVNSFNFGLTRIRLNRTGPLNMGLSLDTIDVSTDFTTTSRPYARDAPTYNLTDDLTWNKGKHTLTMGENIRFIRNQRSNYQNAFPSYSFSRGSLLGLGSDITGDVNAYLANLTGNPSIHVTDPTTLQRAFGDVLGLVSSGTWTGGYDKSGNPLPLGAPTVRNFASNEIETYISDNWRVSPNVTLGAGLRWVYYGVPYEQNGLEVIPNFPLQDWFNQRKAGMLAGIPSHDLPNNILTYSLAGPVNGTASWYKPEYGDFAPRASFAYSPTHGFLTKLLGEGGVIRVGGGKVYDRYGSDLVTKFDSNASFGLSDIDRLGPSWNFSTSPRFTGTLPAMPPLPIHTFPFTAPAVNYVGGSYMGIDSSLHAPHSYNMNVTVSRQLPWGMALETGYIGRWGRDLLMQVDATGGWGIYFTDPQSGMNWHTMSAMMRNYHDAGISTAAVRANPNLIPLNPWVEDMLPAMKNLYFAGSASANYYDLLYNQVGGSDSDAVNIYDRTTSAQFPNCIIKTGCYTLFATQSSGTSMWTNAGYSNFNGGTLSFRRPFRQGFSFDINYTLSHSQDNGIAPEAGGGVGSSIMLNPYNYNAYYGDSDWDARHQLNANVLVELPFGHNKKFMKDASGLLDALAGGWQLSGIFRYRSGLPSSVAYTGIWVTNWSFSGLAFPKGPYNATLQLNNNGNPALFPTTASSAANWESQFPGDVGPRAVVRLDGYKNADLALTKSFRMLGLSNQRMEVRIEAFNAFNWVNFTNIALDANSPNSFGQFTQAAPPRVFQFALRYQF
jgi:hypothetical protein